MAEVISLSRGEVLAIRRLLWEVGSIEGLEHDLKVECFAWATELDHLSGLPPWPDPGRPNEEVIAFYEGVQQHVSEVIAGLRPEQPG